MSDESKHIRSVLATERCATCEGKGTIRGPRVEYGGELVKCPVCNGTRETVMRVPFEMFVMLMKEELNDA